MTAIVIIFLLVLVLMFFAFKMADVFSPWMLTAGVWLAINLLSLNDIGYLDPLSQQFHYCVMLWVPILVLFSTATYYAFPSRQHSFKEEDTELNRGVFMFFFIIAVVCTPFFVYKVYTIIKMFGTEDLFSNIRSLAVLQSKTGDSAGILKYVNTINKALYVIALWNIKKLGKGIFFVVLLINLLYAASIMEKGFLFFLFFSTLFVLYEKQKVKLRTIFLWCLFIIVFFYGFNLLRSNVDADDYGTFGKFFSMYILSPAVAFSKTQEILSDQFGTRSFTFLYSFANKIFSCNYTVMPNLQEFVWVPIPTNVYTVFQPFFQDFGYKGVAFFASVYGVITGFIYRLARNGGQVTRCVYAYVVYILMLQFFQEVFIVGISDLFQYIIIFFLMVQQKFKISFKGFIKERRSE